MHGKAFVDLMVWLMRSLLGHDRHVACEPEFGRCTNWDYSLTQDCKVSHGQHSRTYESIVGAGLV